MRRRAGRWIQVAGAHNSGKTRILAAFVRRLAATDERVLVLKHTHHPVVDESTDSGHYASLGVTVAVLGRDGARFEGLPPTAWLTLAGNADWVVVEGGHAWPTPKVWLGGDDDFKPAPPVVARLDCGGRDVAAAAEELWRRREAWSRPLAEALGLLVPTLARPLRTDATDPTPEEALRILDTVRPVLGTERVDLTAALGRTLAEPVSAPVDCPPFSRAAMDGYAVATAFLKAGAQILPVQAVAAAGDAPIRLNPGEAIRILTGAAIPEGADAVIEQEAVRPTPFGVEVTGPVQPGRHVMPVGHEWRAGTGVWQPGERVTPVHVGILAALGVAAVAVWRRPRIGVVVTGDELTAPGGVLEPGRIFDAQSALLTALVAEWGGDPVRVVRVGDEVGAVRRVVDEMAAAADIVFVTGGVSVGDRDVVPEALAHLGRLLFRRMRLHPGKATVAAVVGKTPVIGLSGNPGAALTTWFALVAPWWAHVHGGELVAVRGIRRLAEAYPKASPHGRWIRVKEAGWDRVAWQSVPQGTDVLSAYLAADGFVEVPGTTGPLPAQTPLAYYAPSGMGGRRPAWQGVAERVD